MQLSLKLSALVALVLVPVAETSFVQANAADRFTPSLSHEGSFSLTEEEVDSLSLSCQLHHPAIFQLHGSYTRYRLNALPPHSLFDARRATWTPDIRRSTAAVRLSGGRNVCWIGGQILANGARQNAESDTTHNNFALVIRTGDPTAAVVVNGLGIKQATNGIDVRGRAAQILLENTEMVDLSGTCLRFQSSPMAEVRHSLLDGCTRLLTFDRGHAHSGDALLLRGNVIRIKLDDDKNGVSASYESMFGHGKSEKLNYSIELRDNVILLEGNHKAITSFITAGLFDEAAGCSNNVLILPQEIQYSPKDVACLSISYDATIWSEARRAWISRNSGNAASSAQDSDWSNRMLDDYMADASAGDEDHVSNLAETAMEEAGADRSEARESTVQAAKAAESSARRWSDGTFWHDGTGWLR